MKLNSTIMLFICSILLSFAAAQQNSTDEAEVQTSNCTK